MLSYTIIYNNRIIILDFNTEVTVQCNATIIACAVDIIVDLI
jgi:hypothetical protein